MEETIIFNECMGVNGRIAYLYRTRIARVCCCLTTAPVDRDGYRNWSQRLKWNR